jgi:N6-L-threonylcarbamoyladenine synthase
MLNQKNYDFSFSGLKTAVLYYLRDLSGTDSGNLARIATAQIGKNTRGPRAPANLRQLKSDVAASFQAAAIDVLVQKTMRAAREFGVRSVMLSGGVAANMALQNAMRREAKKIGARFFAPATPYNTDNAAMIAVAGYFAHLRRKHYELEAQGMLNI